MCGSDYSSARPLRRWESCSSRERLGSRPGLSRWRRLHRSSATRRPSRPPADSRAAGGPVGAPFAQYDASVRLTGGEEQRLLIFSAAELARRHRAAGLLLNAPEAVAIICDDMLEAARAGR